MRVFKGWMSQGGWRSQNGIEWGLWPLSWRPSVFQPLPWYLDRWSSTQENTIPHAFQRSRIFLLIEMPTNDA